MSSTERSETPSEDVRRLVRWLWIDGLAAIALGAAGIAFPFLLTLATELLLGAILAALGAVEIIRAVFSGDVASRTWTLLFGAVSLSAGVLLLLYPLEGILTLTVALATFFVVGGVLKLMGAWQMRPNRMRELGFAEVPGRGWLALSGALSLLLGFVLFFGLPTTAAWAVGLLLGIDLLFLGFTQIGLAMGLKRSHGKRAAA